MNPIIGVSNGWLYEKGVILSKDQEEIFSLLKLEYLELNFGDINRFRCLNNGTDFSRFKNISLHLPNLNSGINIDELINLLKSLLKKIHIRFFIIHPLNLGDESCLKLKSLNVPVLIENLDKNYPKEKEIKNLKYVFKNFDFHFVLDVQHAYEQDNSMGYAQLLFDKFKDRLKEIHISGELDIENHSLVHKSKNRESILNFMKRTLPQKSVPLIIEGNYSNFEELNNEIKFLKEKLNFLN